MAEHFIWVLRSGEIESHFGLADSSKGNYSKATQKVLAHEIPLHPEITEMLHWASTKGAA